MAAGAAAVLLAACSDVPRGPSAPDALRAGRAERETELNRQWQNHSLAELLLGFGRPELLLDIPGGGNPPGFVLVYARDAGTGCLDTFAVVSGPVIRVRMYQCR
ncbi:hypothetical protein JJ685_11245 [Ramlibacter monticola]|uniref:Uncharacterized protein n=1 Tax=Ramlibacter monticola TaxID=1926872 RepID=A0A937CSY9_9BURK|nr:hypothetical protein [Ramlibacter monticola]MBL0391711.1 hypothetical protein [Ramlibacter monticola]